MQVDEGYGTIIRQEISEHSARVALTMGVAARVFRWIVVIVRDVLVISGFFTIITINT